MLILFATIIIFTIAMLGFAVGYLLQGKCLRGTCGTDDVIGPDGEVLRCAVCPRRRSGDCEGEEHPAPSA